MIWLRKLQLRCRALLRRNELEVQMDEEIRSHIEMQTQEHIEAGMTPQEARYAALREFGWVESVKETCREQRGVRWLENLVQDARYGVRMWCKHPSVAAVGILTLALGIGANTVVFTWIHTTLLDTIRGAGKPGRLAIVVPSHRSSGLGETMSLPDIESLAAERRLFAGVTASQMGAVPVRLGTTTEWLWGQNTLANYFEVLAVKPALGRGFLPGEDRPETKERVAVISYGLWQSRFAGNRDVLGRVIEVNQRPVTIVGVTPEGFCGTVGGLAFDLWVPLATESGSGELRQRFDSRNWRWLHTFVRLADGISLQQAQAGAATVGQRLAGQFPDTNKDTTFAVRHLWEAPWGGQALFLPLLSALAVVAGLLLLLVTANVANLLLARTHARQREMALRLALGSSRRRLLLQLVVESLLLAGLGGAGGLGLAWWGRNLLLALMPPSYLPIHYDMCASSGVLGATATITLLSGLLVGLAPAFSACRTNLNQTLHASGYGIAGPGSQSWLRQALVVGQVAAAMVLLLGMGLCVRSFAAAQDMDLGFQPRGLWLAGFRINPHQGDDNSVRAFYRRLQSEACLLPGVESAALSSYLPLGLEGIDRSSVSISGYVPAPGENPTSGRSVVSPGYFHTLQIPLVAGREFSDADSAGGTPFVAVVNEAFVAKYFPGRDPLGLTFTLERGSARVIGVVKTGKYESLKETASPHFFLSTTQQAERNVTLAVRTHGPPSAIGRSVANLAISLDPSAPPHAAMLCEDYVRSAFTVSRVAASLMSALGLAALLLAVLGVYAILSQQVNARIPELGVRAALGARPIDAVWLVVSRGLRLATIGIVIGALGGWGVCRLLSALLVGTTAGDLATWVLAPTLLLCAVLAACWLPARRAANINPMEALRYE